MKPKSKCKLEILSKINKKRKERKEGDIFLCSTKKKKGILYGNLIYAQKYYISSG